MDDLAANLETKAPPQGAGAKVAEKIFIGRGAPIAKDPDFPFAENNTTFPEAPTPSVSRETAVGVPRETKISPAPKNHLAGEIVQPGEYRPEYCEQMIAFFDRDKYTTITETYSWRNGSVEERSKKVPNVPPEFSEFARTIGVTSATLKKWARQHPEFREAYETCKEIYEEFLVHHGLLGNYGAIFGKFVAVNRTKMKDKQIHENRIIDMRKVLDDIAAGKLLPGGALPSEDSEDEEEI